MDKNSKSKSTKPRRRKPQKTQGELVAEKLVRVHSLDHLIDDFIHEFTERTGFPPEHFIEPLLDIGYAYAHEGKTGCSCDGGCLKNILDEIIKQNVITRLHLIFAGLLTMKLLAERDAMNSTQKLVQLEHSLHNFGGHHENQS